MRAPSFAVDPAPRNSQVCRHARAFDTIITRLARRLLCSRDHEGWSPAARSHEAKDQRPPRTRKGTDHGKPTHSPTRFEGGGIPAGRLCTSYHADFAAAPRTGSRPRTIPDYIRHGPTNASTLFDRLAVFPGGIRLPGREPRVGRCTGPAGRRPGHLRSGDPSALPAGGRGEPAWQPGFSGDPSCEHRGGPATSSPAWVRCAKRTRIPGR